MVYQVYVFYDQWSICLVAMATLNLKKIKDNSSQTTEAVWLIWYKNVAPVRTIQTY